MLAQELGALQRRSTKVGLGDPACVCPQRYINVTACMCRLRGSL